MEKSENCLSTNKFFIFKKQQFKIWYFREIFLISKNMATLLLYLFFLSDILDNIY